MSLAAEPPRHRKLSSDRSAEYTPASVSQQMAYSLMMTSFDNSAVVGAHVKSVTKRASYGKNVGANSIGCVDSGSNSTDLRGGDARAGDCGVPNSWRAARARAGPQQARAPKPKPTPRGPRQSAPGFGGGFRKRARAPRWRRQASAPARRAAGPRRTRIASHHAHVVPCQFRCATGTYIHHIHFSLMN